MHRIQSTTARIFPSAFCHKNVTLLIANICPLSLPFYVHVCQSEPRRQTARFVLLQIFSHEETRDLTDFNQKKRSTFVHQYKTPIITMESLHSFKIPSPKNRFHRKSFYGLHRRFEEPIEKWFERIETDINLCGFDKLAEYLLLDKFFSELNDGEIATLHSEGQTWSLRQLHRYLHIKNGYETESGLSNGIQMNTGNAQNELRAMESVEVVMEAVPMKMELVSS